MTSTHVAELHLPLLPKQARQVHLFPALHKTSLLSIGKLCDAGCTATFTADHLHISYNDTIILQGTRSGSTGLWEISNLHSYIPKAPTNAYVLPSSNLKAPNANTSNSSHLSQANNATTLSNAAKMVQYSHATLFSPTISTLKTALEKGFIQNFPGLTLNNLKQYKPNSLATAKGHLDQIRANQKSTKPSQLPTPDNDLHDCLFPQEIIDQQHNEYCFATFFDCTQHSFSDQTGRFPVTSLSGHKYIFLLYHYDTNYIYPQAIKDRSAPTILSAFQTALNLLKSCGHKPKLHTLDNECSALLKEYLSQQDIAYQLTPPYIHRRNAAERAIRTFKNHFIAGLSSTDPTFPLKLWDKLIPQAAITLNLMRSSRVNPKLSAYCQIHGHFNYNKTPLGPPGCKVLIHDKATQRKSWDPHGQEGFYLGPAMESYRCYKVWNNSTKCERITDTLSWFPHYVHMPTVSPTDILRATAQDILTCLKSSDFQGPLSPVSTSQLKALRQFAEMFSNPTKNDANPEPKEIHDLHISKDTNIIHQNQHNLKSAPEFNTTNPVLRVHNGTPAAPPKTTINPVLRVEDHYQNSPQNDATEHKQPLEELHNSDQTSENIQKNSPNIISQTQEDITTTETDNESSDYYAYTDILSHRKAAKKCGSTYEVKVAWKHHDPTYVPVHVFTEQNNNPTAVETITKYAQQNNLLNTKGWKGFNKFVAHPMPQSNSAQQHQHKWPRKTQTFLESCYHVLQQQEQANKAINPDTGKLSEYPILLQSSDGIHWEKSCCEEIGRLAQGYPPSDIQGTDTIHFIKFDQIPSGRTPTYLRLVVADRPMKSNPRRVRFTVGGDKVNYPGDVSTKTADLITAKTLINSTISTEGARFMSIDIKDFYLNNDMDRYEYMKIPIKLIPEEIMTLYNLQDRIHKGYVYVEIRKGMYGLPQAGRIANDKLVPILDAAGYHQSQHTPGLFKHETRPLAFCLVVDDFGVKYVGREHVDHLIHTLEKANYKITTDWAGTTFCGLTLQWDYDNGKVYISMPGYIEKALQRFNHPTPKKPEHAPHAWTKPQYGSKIQMTAPPDSTQPLDKTGIKRLQEIIGTLLFYARAVDSTMLVALGTLAAAQTKGTEATAKACTKLLNYAATHPNATLCYHASDMLLYIHSDASYLSESEARSRAGGIFFLSNYPTANISSPDSPHPPINGAIHIISTIMNNVCASATEAEVGACFHNAQDACMIRHTLEFLGHPQPATPIQTDNSCAEGIINDTVKQKRSKAIDMRFYWVRDRVRQGQFIIHWKRGRDNYADYYTKHFPASHHQQMRPIYLHDQAHCLLTSLL